MICSVCKKQRHVTEKQKSVVYSEMVLNICGVCKEQKLEPRYLVVLAGRSMGIDSVKKHIKNKLYPGEEITAAELSK